MTIVDLKIGDVFVRDEMRWRVTDIGSRVVVAIYLNPEHTEDWFLGPPYAVAEMVFDKHDLIEYELES